MYENIWVPPVWIFRPGKLLAHTLGETACRTTYANCNFFLTTFFAATLRVAFFATAEQCGITQYGLEREMVAHAQVVENLGDQFGIFADR